MIQNMLTNKFRYYMSNETKIWSHKLAISKKIPEMCFKMVRNAETNCKSCVLIRSGDWIGFRASKLQHCKILCTSSRAGWLALCSKQQSSSLCIIIILLAFVLNNVWYLCVWICICILFQDWYARKMSVYVKMLRTSMFYNYHGILYIILIINI